MGRERAGDGEALTAQQRAAAEHSGSPMIVLAGPGTGKTRVIAHRVAHMIRARGVRPETIVAVTYTVKAAEQLRERLAGLIGMDAQRVHAHTIHGLGLRILQRFGDEAGLATAVGRGTAAGPGTIMDSAQRVRLLREIVRDHGLFPGLSALGSRAIVDEISRSMNVMSDAALLPEDVRGYVSRARESLERGEDALGGKLDEAGVLAERERVERWWQIARAAELYDAARAERGWLEFSDLIAMPTTLLRERPRVARLIRGEWRHWVIDEFQDVNAAQIEFFRQLCPPGSGGGEGPDICAVGDDDQAIYGFRGADERAMERFSHLWPGTAVYKLTENFRSNKSVVAVANSVIGRAARRFDTGKSIVAAGPTPDAKVECVELAEEMEDADVITAMLLMDRAEHAEREWSTYAVIARNRGDLERVRTALELEGVPTTASGGGGVAEDAGVARVLMFVEAMVEEATMYPVLSLLLRPPIALGVGDAQKLGKRYQAYASLRRLEGGGAVSMGAWLAEHARGEHAGVDRLIAWMERARQIDATAPAMETIEEIVRMMDVVHADVLPARERARRVSNVVSMLRFVRDRQARLSAPGDLRAFHAYYRDLDPREAEMGREAAHDRIDEGRAEEDEAEGVRMLTAHGAKGLEFDTVFVPRVSPKSGYGSSKQDRGLDVPCGMIGGALESAEPAGTKGDEERRVFYVACTRAERRLVLLSKKNKKPSRSVHYFEELIADKSVDGARVVRQSAEVFAAAAAAKVGGESSRWRTEDEAGGVFDARREGLRELVQRERRAARRAAAMALDHAESQGDVEGVASAEVTLRRTARGLALLQAVESTGSLPAWAKDGETEMSGLVARLQAAIDDDAASRVMGGDGTWDALVAANRVRGPLRLSYSAIWAYATCPRCYFVKYVLGLSEADGEEANVGTLVHRILEKYFRAWRDAEAEGGVLPDAEVLARMGKDVLGGERSAEREIDVVMERQVLAQIEAARRMHVPESNILELEHSVNMAWGPHTISMRFDRIDELPLESGGTELRIIDYKTGNPSKSKSSPARDDLQLGLYALAARETFNAQGGAGRAEYWLLQSGERGVLGFADIQEDKLRKKVDKVIDGILEGRFERGDGDRFGHACDVLGELGRERTPVERTDE